MLSYAQPSNSTLEPQYYRHINCSRCIKNLQSAADQTATGRAAYNSRKGGSPSTRYSRSPARETSPRSGTRFCALDASQADVVDAGPTSREKNWKVTHRCKIAELGGSRRMVFGDLVYNHCKRLCDETCRRFPESIKPAKKPVKFKPSEWDRYHPDSGLEAFAKREIQKLKAKEAEQEYQRQISRYGYTPRASDESGRTGDLDDSYL